jgi:hypothetical protein
LESTRNPGLAQKIEIALNKREEEAEAHAGRRPRTFDRDGPVPSKETVGARDTRE